MPAQRSTDKEMETMESTEDTEPRSFTLGHSTHLWSVLSMAVALALWATAEAATPSYTYKPFTPLPGLSLQGVYGVEYGSATMVGASADPNWENLLHGWQGTATAGFTIRPTLEVRAINRAKWTAGSFFDAFSGLLLGYVQSPSAFTPIYVPGCTHVYVRGLNDFNQVVGACQGEDGWNHAFYWDAETGARLLDPIVMENGTPVVWQLWGCGATAINHEGYIAGGCDHSGYVHHYQLPEAAARIDIPLAGQPARTFLLGITDVGRILGTVCPFEPGTCRGLIWTPGVTTLIDYPGETFLTAIVGQAPGARGTLFGYHGGNGTAEGFRAIRQ